MTRKLEPKKKAKKFPQPAFNLSFLANLKLLKCLTIHDIFVHKIFRQSLVNVSHKPKARRKLQGGKGRRQVQSESGFTRAYYLW